MRKTVVSNFAAFWVLFPLGYGQIFGSTVHLYHRSKRRRCAEFLSLSTHKDAKTKTKQRPSWGFWHAKKPANGVFTGFGFKQITGVEERGWAPVIYGVLNQIAVLRRFAATLLR